jgi:cytoskeletal protein CcmA (bactofilin family)
MALKDLMSRGQTANEPVRPAPPAITTPPPAPPAPAPKAAPTTYLGPATSFSGELRCSESLRIDGRIEGRVSCEHMVAVGESGSVRAAIEGDTVVVAGEVVGNITAVRKITLEGTARVTGDLCTPGIVIQEGAILEGRIMIGGDAPRTGATADAKAAPRSADAARPANATSAPAQGAVRNQAAPPALR